MVSLRRGFVFIAFVVVLAACDTIPREALNGYISAFNEARTAGELLTNDYAAAKAESDRRDAARIPPAPVAPQPEIPLLYTPPPKGDGPPSATEVRLLAWEVIARYNAALAALSAGESSETVKTATERLGTVAGKIASLAGVAVPGMESIIAAAQEITAMAEKARLSGEFKKAITGGVPKVRGMLQVMIADTSAHYQLRAALANEDLVDVPTDENVKRERIKASIAELKKSLDQFVMLARKCDESLGALQDTTENPLDFVSSSNELFTLALTVKTHWTAYQAARVEGAK